MPCGRCASRSTRLDSADPLLRHKTTRRQVYEAARAEFSREEADEVLLLNERGEVCEGTITNVFIDIGEPRAGHAGADLRAAARRAARLDDRAGDAREAVLTDADLRAAKAIYVGNSLRGLIRARLA